MARPKQPVARDPADFKPTQRSQCRRAAVLPPTNQGETSRVDLETEPTPLSCPLAVEPTPETTTVVEVTTSATVDATNEPSSVATIVTTTAADVADGPSSVTTIATSTTTEAANEPSTVTNTTESSDMPPSTTTDVNAVATETP